jgi:hypothetical protein
VAGTSTDAIYAAMDWLVARQDSIEKQLARRHLAEGGIAMFDLARRRKRIIDAGMRTWYGSRINDGFFPHSGPQR